MRKVMLDEDLERILAPKIEEERRQKAQKKARDQLNYERYQERSGLFSIQSLKLMILPWHFYIFPLLLQSFRKIYTFLYLVII